MDLDCARLWGKVGLPRRGVATAFCRVVFSLRKVALVVKKEAYSC